MAYSPASDCYYNLFNPMDNEDITSINPDDFLNLENFPERIETISQSNQSQSMQLTPPISPQPSIILDYNQIQLIPFPQKPVKIQARNETRKVKPIVPKPSSSSDSDSANVTKQTSHSPVDKALIKQQRQIRNRETALLSSKKKKIYVETLGE